MNHARRPDPARLVLGVLLARPDLLAGNRDAIAETDFYAWEHRRIWGAMCELADAGEPPDMVRVAWHLSATPGRELFDAARALATLLDPDELADAGLLPLDPAGLPGWIAEMQAVRRRLRRIVRAPV